MFSNVKLSEKNVKELCLADQCVFWGWEEGLMLVLCFSRTEHRAQSPEPSRVGPMPRSVRQQPAPQGSAWCSEWGSGSTSRSQVAPGFRATPGKHDSLFTGILTFRKCQHEVLAYTDKVNTNYDLQLLWVVGILRMTAPNYKVQIESNLKMLFDLSLQEKCYFSIKTRSKHLQKYPELYNVPGVKDLPLCLLWQPSIRDSQTL